MNRWDLIVIGGGPAGATLATVVARAGHRVLLVDRQRFPRYQIGESLLPATVRQLADILGVRERLQEAGFVVKRGATFSWGLQPDSLWTMNFGRVPAEQMDLPPEAPSSYNVPRHEFDRLLLENARERGVDVRAGCTVTRMIGGEDAIHTVRYTDEEGTAHEEQARFIALASGQSALAAPIASEREYSTFFRKIGVFGYFEGSTRLPRPLDGNTFFEASPEAWLWHIPLSDRLTSVGAVVPAAEASRLQKGTREALAHYISGCPRVAAMLRDATPSTQVPFDTVRTRSEYSYCHTRFWAPGVVRVGDAACFVDVLLSSGVHLATYGALLAGRSIDAVLAGRASEEHAMNEFEARLRLEFALFYRGLLGLYDTSCDSDAYVEFLRRLLQNTNGVFIEWREQPQPFQASLDTDPDALTRSRQNVAAMRDYNARQVRYAGGPGMDRDEAPPLVIPTLTASHNGGQWAAVAVPGDSSCAATTS